MKLKWRQWNSKIKKGEKNETKTTTQRENEFESNRKIEAI